MAAVTSGENALLGQNFASLAFGNRRDLNVLFM